MLVISLMRLTSIAVILSDQQKSKMTQRVKQNYLKIDFGVVTTMTYSQINTKPIHNDLQHFLFPSQKKCCMIPNLKDLKQFQEWVLNKLTTKESTGYYYFGGFLKA